MDPAILSSRDRVQLFLLRFLSTVLGVVDGLLNVDWGEKLLSHMARRWQAKLAQLDQALADLERERRQVRLQADALAIHAAAIYLGGRRLARGELRFDPADARDEEILDATIELLVKEQLAAIEPEQVSAGQYVYHLEPDWPAIYGRLMQARDQANADLADWFGEGLAFIGEAFLSQPNPC